MLIDHLASKAVSRAHSPGLLEGMRRALAHIVAARGRGAAREAELDGPQADRGQGAAPPPIPQPPQTHTWESRGRA